MLQHTFTLALSIEPEQLKRFYRGDATQIVATAQEGVSIAFPAEAVRPFVTATGVHGDFVLTTDAQFRLLSIYPRLLS